MRRMSLLFLLALVASTPLGAQDGEPVRCVSGSLIDHTEIIDDRTIAFHMRGGDIYVNRLDRACRNLDRGQPISYRPLTGRICAADSITVLEGSGFGLSSGASCRLRDFVPTDEETLEMLKGDQEPADVTVEEIEVEE